MNSGVPNYIAGRRTATDWHILRPRLLQRDAGAWEEGYRGFFVERLQRRYLDPIAVLQANGTLSGEGFSIVAIQCSLIEFLESTRQGTSYRRPTSTQPLVQHEYSASGRVFTAFLHLRPPFSNTFTEVSAEDFYVNVRCALLHEARTKSGWRIWADGPTAIVADTTEKKVYRNNFQGALLQYIKAFGPELASDNELQDAFIRKFDSLCD